MANITISIIIPSTLAARTVTAFRASYGYQPLLDDRSPNPQTPAEFIRQTVLAYIRQTVISYERQQSQIAAQQSVDAAAAQASTDLLDIT